MDLQILLTNAKPMSTLQHYTVEVIYNRGYVGVILKFYVQNNT